MFATLTIEQQGIVARVQGHRTGGAACCVLGQYRTARDWVYKAYAGTSAQVPPGAAGCTGAVSVSTCGSELVVSPDCRERSQILSAATSACQRQGQQRAAAGPLLVTG